MFHAGARQHLQVLVVQVVVKGRALKLVVISMRLTPSSSAERNGHMG